MNNKENLPLTEFDVATLSYELQMMKAFIPFMDMPQQKSFAMFIRVFEMIKTLDFYNNMPEPCPLHRSRHDKKEMFDEMKCYCPKKDREIFEMMSNMDNITEYYNMFQAMSSANDTAKQPDDGKQHENNKQSNILKNFLSPKQQELYESYQKMLNL